MCCGFVSEWFCSQEIILKYFRVKGQDICNLSQEVQKNNHISYSIYTFMIVYITHVIYYIYIHGERQREKMIKQMRQNTNNCWMETEHMGRSSLYNIIPRIFLKAWSYFKIWILKKAHIMKLQLVLSLSITGFAKRTLLRQILMCGSEGAGLLNQ